MGRKKNPTSQMDVAEKMRTPLAQRLDALITDANALKDNLGVSIQAVNQYRLGLARPSLENLCKIADFYKVSADYLLGRSDTQSVKKDIQVACKTTGLSDAAIIAIEFDHSRAKLGEIFEIEDYLIREFYVRFIATQIRNCVRSIIEVRELGKKLGSDIVEDETKFYKWRAINAVEKAIDGVITDLSSHFSVPQRMNDIKTEYVKTKIKEYTDRLDRLNQIEQELNREVDDGQHQERD